MARMAFPLKPPAGWFEQPEASVATPLTFQKDGQVFGHIALWGSCHTGFLNGAVAECVQPPPSKTEYQHFHLGVIETQDGQDVRVGKITYATGHAPLSASARVAADHYDNTGSVGAYVRARNGAIGIWVSGAVRSDISAEGFRDLRANPPSGDWRSLNRNLELVAALAVPVPGFPIPRATLSLAASADGTPEVESLILPAWQLEEEFALVASADYQERKKALSSEIAVPVERDRGFLRRRRTLSASLSE
tara:strand:- start:46 stop:792 length:747 start_codon:yes stop_codon:yes gene_type:complete